LRSTAHLKVETLTLAVDADAGAERGDERIQATGKQQTACLGDSFREPGLQPLPLARKRGLPIGLEQRAQPFQESSRIQTCAAERATGFARSAVLAHRQEVSELGHDCLLGKRAQVGETVLERWRSPGWEAGEWVRKRSSFVRRRAS
jgi:hypothetical protein